MKTVHFIPNEPVTLSLKEASGVIDGFNVLYETWDGRLLSLPRPAAVKLNELDPAPGEEFLAIMHQDGKAPREWTFALTARSEQLRAEQEAAELAEQTKRDLPAQLKASVLRQMPKSANKPSREASESPKGDGTYGPLPQVALAGRKTRETIPYNLAFREVVAFVTKELNDSGEQWSEQSRQDLVSTVLIAASKQGILGVWER